MILVSIIRLIAVSGGILFRFHTSYREKVGAHLETLVKKHKQNIDHFLQERLSNISFLAGTFTDEKLSDSAVLAQVLRRLQETYGPVFSDLGVVGKDDNPISYAGPFPLARAQYAEAEWFQPAIRLNTFTSDVFLGLGGFRHFIATARRQVNAAPWILRATVDFLSFNDLAESIHIVRSDRTVQIQLKGDFDGTSAHELANMPTGLGSSFANVAIDTDGL